MLELRLEYLVAILAMSLNYSIPSNSSKNLLHVNRLTSIQVAQIIIVTKIEYRPQGLTFKNSLSIAVIIFKSYPSYAIVK